MLIFNSYCSFFFFFNYQYKVYVHIDFTGTHEDMAVKQLANTLISRLKTIDKNVHKKYKLF